MKNTIAVLMIVFLLGSAYWLGTKKVPDLTPEQQKQGNPTEVPTVTPEKEINAKNESPIMTKTEIVSPSDEELLKNILGDEITIKTITETHAKGYKGNGMWLAVKKGSIWKIEYEGNGQADCKKLEADKFPKEMLIGICY